MEKIGGNISGKQTSTLAQLDWKHIRQLKCIEHSTT